MASVLRVTRSFCVAIAASLFVLTGLAVPASAAPKESPVGAMQLEKCGSLDNGELCLYSPEGSKTGYYTTEYCRTGGSGTITVQFGYQLDGGSYVWDGWENQFISTGNCGSYTRYLSSLPADGAIRGIMMSSGNVYVTRWRFI
ncbi:hypothetical protein GCM10023079_17990 [Streptomyces chitinivorans]